MRSRGRARCEPQSGARGHTTSSKVVLGGQRIDVARPRVRSVDAGELQLPTFQWAASVDPLNNATMAAIAAGVSTRRYASTLDALPATQRSSSTSSSAVSRRFVALSQQQLDDWLHRKLGELDLPVVMIDGIHFRDRVVLIAVGIEANGTKHVLGLREGSTESTRVVRAQLQRKHPGAAASLREGLEETLTVQELGITGALYRTLRTTNPIERRAVPVPAHAGAA